MAAKKRVRWRHGFATINGLACTTGGVSPDCYWAACDANGATLASAEFLFDEPEARRVAEFLAVVVSERKVKRGK